MLMPAKSTDAAVVMRSVSKWYGHYGSTGAFTWRGANGW